MKNIKFTLIVCGLIGIGACNKDNSPTNSVKPIPPKLPAASSVSIKLPQNAVAQVRSFYNYVYASMNGALNHYENVKNQIPTYNNPIWTWIYNAAGYHITLEAVALAGDSSSWKILISGNSLNNWISATGKATADSEYGVWRFYLYNSTVLQESAVWCKNGQNAITIDAVWFRDLDPADDIPGNYIDIKIAGNSDASGSLNVMEKGIKIFEASWGVSGAGSWAAYDPSTGHQTDGGSWGPG